jgi:fumarylacetoacetate (FAA) hydrolase
MYQGGSDSFLSPTEDICLAEESWGIDFEAEVAVITNDVPMGIDPETAKAHIQLVMLVNDISLRNVIADELNKGFGFFQSKPSSAFSPVAVTPSSLGSAWEDGKLHLPVRATLNGKLVGQPNAGVDMTFDFGQLIAHAAKTRSLCAGTIIGSGTVSNVDKSKGSCCLAEIRMIETIIHGEAKTPFMRHGDRIQIDAYNALGESVFGQIDQYLSK